MHCCVLWYWLQALSHMSMWRTLEHLSIAFSHVPSMHALEAVTGLRVVAGSLVTYPVSLRVAADRVRKLPFWELDAILQGAWAAYSMLA